MIFLEPIPIMIWIFTQWEKETVYGKEVECLLMSKIIKSIKNEK